MEWEREGRRGVKAEEKRDREREIMRVAGRDRPPHLVGGQEEER